MGNPKINSSTIERPPAKPLPSAAEQRAARLASGHVVIVCGGPTYDDRDRVFAALDRVHERQAITLLVHGACMDRKAGRLLGVDRWADEWAAERGVRIERHPEDRATWGTSAAAIGAKQMVEAGAHGCVAFPGALAGLCEQAYRFDIPVWRPFG
jgi:hypothetical protein